MTLVYIAVGHGLKPDGVTYDPGAIGGGWSEQSAGDHIVAEAAAVLRGMGVAVIDEANKNDPNYPGTARAANAARADYVVSVHHDWIKAPQGAFGHWYTDAGKALADDIQSAVGSAGFLLRPSWHKRRTDLTLLKSTNAPAVIYECGRIGEIRTPEALRRMGRAIAAGIAKHIGAVAPPVIEEDELDAEAKSYIKETRDLARQTLARLVLTTREDSFRQAIIVALANGDIEHAADLAKEAHGLGIVTGYRKNL